MDDQNKLRDSLKQITIDKPQSLRKLAAEIKIDIATLTRFLKGEKVYFLQQCKIEKFVQDKQKELNK